LRVKNLIVVEPMTDVDSEGLVIRKRKRIEDNYRLSILIENL